MSTSPQTPVPQTPGGPPRRHSPAAERNRGPILNELRRLLPPSGLLLEIASGTGQHAAHCSAGLPGWCWLPSEHEPASLASIDAWCQGLDRVQPPILLDVRAASWPGVPPLVDAVFCANLLHIAPWDCCTGLMQGAARHLSAPGLLLTYGPYLEDEVATTASNLAFDADLRSRDVGWGLRRREDVETVAAQAGLHLQERVAMPANNLLLVWARGRPVPD
ncbi:MAG: DUF938 domain-containing protein [Rubrivivax sp.]|nr:DUF938 domain-containing protein [Rubrivivax sp.]